jgi:photosystem II Psb27 protein
VLALEVSDPSREATLKDIKAKSTSWVATYRRDSRYSGRPSYGNTYTAVNALAGHLNSFGFAAAIPKKRVERISKEVSDADKLLQRGR